MDLAIRNYRIRFPLRKDEFVVLEDCYRNLLGCGVSCKLDLESYKAVFVEFEELSFNFFSSGKGTLYFRRDDLSVEEADVVLNRFFVVFVKPFVIG